MINARIIVFACLVLAPCWAHADDSDESGQDLVSTYVGIPEFARADSVIWCEPIPKCQQWTKANSSPNNVEAAPGSLGSVFIIVVANTDEPLSPEDEAFIFVLADGLKDGNVELTGAAFIPPSPDTDELRKWIQARCLNC